MRDLSALKINDRILLKQGDGVMEALIVSFSQNRRAAYVEVLSDSSVHFLKWVQASDILDVVPDPRDEDEDTEAPFQDLRIYVLLAEEVLVEDTGQTVSMPSGRRMAQAAHVVSKMRVQCAEEFGDAPITTIALSVLDNRVLDRFHSYLACIPGIEPRAFHDSDLAFYGSPKPVLTAVCTRPVRREDVPMLADLVKAQ
jgi:hypothetical protein